MFPLLFAALTGRWAPTQRRSGPLGKQSAESPGAATRLRRQGDEAELGLGRPSGVEDIGHRPDDDQRASGLDNSRRRSDATPDGEVRPPAGDRRRVRPKSIEHPCDRTADPGRCCPCRRHVHERDTIEVMNSHVARAPTPVGPSRWQFPDPNTAAPDGLVGLGADLEPSTLIAAYRHGLFPMPAGDAMPDEDIAWWSPDPRGILELDDLHVSRSLARSCRRMPVTVDRAFGEVIGACATLPRPGGWISPAIVAAYEELHRLGWAHSVEVWSDRTDANPRLVGGVYGVQIQGFFAGESMFRLANDASKVALVGLVAALRRAGVVLFDVQWETEHLATLGVGSITRSDYLARLAHATTLEVAPLCDLTDDDRAARGPSA